MILDAMEVMCTVYTTVPEIYLSQLHGQKTIQPKVMGGMRLLIGCCPARSGRPGTPGRPSRSGFSRHTRRRSGRTAYLRCFRAAAI